MVHAGTIDPCLGRTIEFDQLPEAHAAMGRGEEVYGNVVARVGADRENTRVGANRENAHAGK
jgi:crotonyl-CoA carboxylase/reductase